MGGSKYLPKIIKKKKTIVVVQNCMLCVAATFKHCISVLELIFITLLIAVDG